MDRRQASRLAMIAGLGATVCSPSAWASARPDEDDHDHDSCLESRLEGMGVFRGARSVGDDAAWKVPTSDDSRAYDDATGRDLRNYPRYPVVDFEHMTLNVLVPDMGSARLEASQSLRFRTLLDPVDLLTLDAKLMKVRSVASPGREVKFTHDGQTLKISFDPPIEPGTSTGVEIAYTVMDPPFGIVWTLDPPDKATGGAAQMHTKGQPEFNSYWFPTHDFPNDRQTTEIIATVPAGYDAVSNGRLVGVENTILSQRASIGESSTAGTSLGMYRKFHWKQAQPHVPYLVSLAVGKWDVVDVNPVGSRNGMGAHVPMPVYVPQGRGGDVPGTYSRTPEMMKLYERLLDEPYPWEKYAHVIAWNYISGATEHTSATTMHDTAIYSSDALIDHDLDGLISHEIAHQWFGNLITCKSWEHIWINEGWATYCESLWFEHRDGPERYMEEIQREFDSAMSRDKAEAPKADGMASKEYRFPRETFLRAANPYSKGASLLHMLRMRLGDEAFFRGTALFLDRHKFGQVETSDFQAAMEEASGEALDLVFHQLCERPGFPIVEIDASWDPSAAMLNIRAVQTQRIDGPNPAFEFDLPIVVRTGVGETTLTLEVRGRETETAVPIAAEPSMVAVDPTLTVFARISPRMPAEWLREQVRSGPTIASKVQAVRALASMKDDAAASMFEVEAFRAGSSELLRTEAVKGLDRLGATGRLESCLVGRINDPLVREAAVNAAASATKDRKDEGAERARERVAEMLARKFENDPSVRVRAASLRGIARLGATRYLPLAIDATRIDSQDDRIRQAALDALATLDAPECVSIASAMVGAGTSYRTRTAAVETLAKLAKHDPDAVFETLADLVEHGYERTRRAAGQALVDIADARGIPLLERLVSESTDPLEKQMLGDWLGGLRFTLSKTAAVESE
jgi:aminopeptidase N